MEAAYNLNNIETQFQEAMINAGIVINDIPVADSQLHRFRVDGDKKGSNNGWYVLYGDDNPKGCFGSWKLGINENWSLKDFKSYTPQERAKWAKQMAEAKKERENAQGLRHREARSEALRLWGNAKKEKGGHAYLKDKEIQAYKIRTDGIKLLIPLRDPEGTLHSLQFVSPNGSKLFLNGGAIQGHYFGIGKPSDTLVIVEGYSTGSSIHEATGHAVAVAFNAGNLLPVAQVLRGRFPNIEIIIAGDNDQWLENNIGVTKATETAKAVNGKLVIPEFQNTESKPTDFNDMAMLEGLEQVKKSINEVQQISDKPPGEKQSVEPEMMLPEIEEIAQHEENTDTNQFMIQKIEELALLSNLEYEQVRKKEAKALNIRESILDKEITKERKRVEQEELAHNSIVSDVEEWPEAIQGDQLLSELKEIYKQYSILPEGADVALSLWTLGTYCFDAFRIFPMIGLSSPEKRCGKSTVMSLLQATTNKPLLSSNISPAAIYRVAELCKPTLLIDEADTFLKGNDELRGIINSGHTRDTAFVVRIEGENLEPKRFSTWTPKALAMIGDLPDTNKDRSIVILMRRRLPNEAVTKMPLNAAEQFKDIRRKCKRWAADNFDLLVQYTPTLPNHNNDRELDNWTPLFSIAGLCGNEKAALDSMASISPVGDEESIGPMILSDIKTVFDNRGVDKVFSEDLVNDLIEFDNRPWAEWKHDKPITKNSIARLLKPYKIKSKSIRFGTLTGKGYTFESFQDTFFRYLSTDTHSQNVTPSQVSDSNTLIDKSKRHTTDDVAFQKSLKPTSHNDCYVVTDVNMEVEDDECISRVQVSI